MRHASHATLETSRDIWVTQLREDALLAGWGASLGVYGMAQSLLGLWMLQMPEAP